MRTLILFIAVLTVAAVAFVSSPLAAVAAARSDRYLAGSTCLDKLGHIGSPLRKCNRKSKTGCEQ